MKRKMKILHIDIETAPIGGAVWQMWDNNLSIDSILTDWFIMAYSAKWDGEREVLANSLYENQKLYRKEPQNDIVLLQELHALLDEADVVVAHNGDKFDIPKINARFMLSGILPPSPYQKVDTLKCAKRHFKFTSNKLDYLARFLGLGAKMDVGGMETWVACLNGSPEAWDKMLKYNIVDVKLLEKVYHRLLPWISNHPNHALYYADGVVRCPKCGGTHLQYRGYYYSGINRFRRFQCNTCGGWGRDRIGNLTKEQKGGIVTNAIL